MFFHCRSYSAWLLPHVILHSTILGRSVFAADSSWSACMLRPCGCCARQAPRGARPRCRIPPVPRRAGGVSKRGGGRERGHVRRDDAGVLGALDCVWVQPLLRARRCWLEMGFKGRQQVLFANSSGTRGRCVARLLGARGCHRYSRRSSKQPSALCTEAAQLLGTERSGPVRSRAGAAVTGHARMRHRQRRAAPKQARARARAGGGRRDPGPGARGRRPGRVHGAGGGARGCARPAACRASRGLPAMPSAPSRPTPPWRELAL